MKTILFLLIFSLSSCAKLSYMSEQAFGHLSLEYNGKDNEDFLKDPKVDPEVKRKIRLIQKAKFFFYDYFKLPATAIYEETTILNQEAVTYLVIHSKKSKIKAIKTSIPFVGKFPYLGFFKKESAQSFIKEKEEEGFATYIRPVYAYSTLNHSMIPFHDNILSSFFRYKDEDLIGTIFHELVHTVIFIDDEVQFNENLAQFISDELMKVYYKENPNYSEEKKLKQQNNQVLIHRIVTLADVLNEKYRGKKKNYKLILQAFLENEFFPEVKRMCEDMLMTSQCWPLKGTWNNARFAALKTYESKRDELGEVYKASKLNLKDFFLKIIEHEDNYDRKKPFLASLKYKDK